MDGPSSRHKILDVAEARFAQRGYAGVGLRELAAASGLGKSSLFHHFPSKADLYLAVTDRVVERIETAVTAPIRATGAPAERLDAAVDALIDTLAEHATGARILLRGLFEDDDFDDDAAGQLIVQRRIENIVALFAGLVKEGVEQGVFREVSIPHTVQTLIGATVYHFASGEFGDTLLGESVFSADAVRARKEEVRAFIQRGLAR